MCLRERRREHQAGKTRARAEIGDVARRSEVRDLKPRK